MTTSGSQNPSWLKVASAFFGRFCVLAALSCATTDNYAPLPRRAEPLAPAPPTLCEVSTRQLKNVDDLFEAVCSHSLRLSPGTVWDSKRVFQEISPSMGRPFKDETRKCGRETASPWSCRTWMWVNLGEGCQPVVARSYAVTFAVDDDHEGRWLLAECSRCENEGALQLGCMDWPFNP
jgi:hypothetical protein